jgi:hypothetical protein
MKLIIAIAVVAVLFAVAPSPCFALWEIAEVTREKAKEMGLEVKSPTKSGLRTLLSQSNTADMPPC